MYKAIITFLMLWMFSPGLRAEVITIEQCVEKAVENYPLVRKYDLLASTCDIALSDINKGWLPRINTSAQATAQNVVPSFPEALSGMLSQMGQSFEGLGKFQYKIGIDLSQNIWDGGASQAQRQVQKADMKVQQDAMDVELYQVRQRVENLFFAILLSEEQIKLNQNTVSLLRSNLDKLQSMLQNGTAMQSDVDMLEAQALVIEQNIVMAQSSANGYRKVLEIFIGASLNDCELGKPSMSLPESSDSNRPELNLFEGKLRLVEAGQRLSDTSIMPKIGLFAQAYYGYPGFDYFKSMMNRNLSFNILAGVKVSWNIDSFYTRKNNSRRNAIEIQNIHVDKDVFLFNSDMQSASVMESINGMREVMSKDKEIISLREKVRKSAESQLGNGVIDATAFLTKVNDENQAVLTASFHEIELLQEIYNLKYILNQ
ncbi:MAG: TolC family protein [Muribaculum sp.]|nr:TolC family protein [Muribaculum sp.]